VLVVDDFPTIRSLVVTFLGDDYVCTEARDGQEALLHTKTARPDVVITDLNMPVMDGLTFLRVLRDHADPAIAKIPVVVLSTNQDRDEALRFGANATLPKRVSARELRAVVEKVLQGTRP
jgi:two-component system chemotaxis response regulator CheY